MGEGGGGTGESLDLAVFWGVEGRGKGGDCHFDLYLDTTHNV